MGRKVALQGSSAILLTHPGRVEDQPWLGDVPRFERPGENLLPAARTRASRVRRARSDAPAMLIWIGADHLQHSEDALRLLCRLPPCLPCLANRVHCVGDHRDAGAERAFGSRLRDHVGSQSGGLFPRDSGTPQRCLDGVYRQERCPKLSCSDACDRCLPSTRQPGHDDKVWPPHVGSLAPAQTPFPWYDADTCVSSGTASARSLSSIWVRPIAGDISAERVAAGCAGSVSGAEENRQARKTR